MQRYYRKGLINFIIITILLTIPTSIFATSEYVTIGEELYFSGNGSTIILNEHRFAPSDNTDYTMTIKNETTKLIGIYFVDAVEAMNNMNLDKMIFSFYINSNLYKRGNNKNLKNQLVYILEPDEEAVQMVNVLLDETAGNSYQGKEFNIEWTIEMKEYIEPIEDGPNPIDIVDGNNNIVIEPNNNNTTINTNKIESNNENNIVTKPSNNNGTITRANNKYITIKESDEEEKQPVAGGIIGYIEEKFHNLTENVNNFVIFIFVIMAILVLTELCKVLWWIIILLIGLRNTKIYIKTKLENGTEKFKLVRKLRTKDSKEIQLDLNRLSKKYKTNDLKIVFNKHISKKIDKAKITINVKEESLSYNIIYENKPIEIDIKI